MDQNLTCVLHGTADGWPNAVCGELAFSWLAEGCAGWQQAYRLCVMENGRPVWDTGWTESRCSASVEYTGPMLCWNRDYTAQVCLRTLLGQELTSAPLHFSTALDPSADWDADWLCSGFVLPGTTAPMFRKQFRLDALPARAKLFFCGLGYHEVYLNGRKVGDQRLSPAWTDYRRRVNYVVYDLLPYLRSGENVIGVMLGAGWYSNEESKPRPCFTAQLHLTMPDGMQQIRRTRVQDGWQCCKTPFLTQASIYIGERMDARLEEPGWTEPDFVSRLEWGPALESEPPEGRLVPMRVEPIRVVSCLAPCSVRQLPSGAAVADFGQNLAGVVQLRMHGLTPGTCVTLRFSEVITPDGELNTENLRTAQQCDVYLARGGEETYCPRFTYHGFRYAEISGLPDPLAAEDVCALVLRSDVASRGSFDSGEPLINDIQRICRWTESNNLHSVPTDCPQRDERLGWLNDLTVRAEEAMFNFEMDSFYRKFVTDMLDAQGKKTGAITDTVPYVRYGSQPADPVCSSFLLLPWMLYQQYGDKQTLRSAYPGLRAWTMYLTRQREDGIVCYSYYGDWASPVGGSVRGSYGSGAVSSITPGRLISTGYLYLNCMLLAQMADVLMLEEDHAYFRELAAQTCSALNRAFLNREGGFYAGNSQAANTFMLYLGVVPEQFRAQVLQNLIRDIQQHDTHVTTGNLCTRYILDVLADNGEIDLAYALVTQTTYPSWGYMLACGATTVWERWEYVDSGELVGMASHDHPMYAAVSGWFYRCLAGLRPDAPAFSRFTLQPYFPRELPEIRCTLHTVKGEIRVEWTQRGGEVRLLVRIPFNASAVWKPTLTLRRLLIDGAPAPDAAEYPLGAGTHSIEFERNDQ